MKRLYYHIKEYIKLGKEYTNIIKYKHKYNTNTYNRSFVHCKYRDEYEHDNYFDKYITLYYLTGMYKSDVLFDETTNIFKPHGRPGKNTGDAISVHDCLAMHHIMELDPKTPQSLHSLIWMRIY